VGQVGSLAQAADALDDSALLERINPAVVMLLTQRGSGTGFVLNDQGDVATNHHVVAGSDEILVQHGEHLSEAKLVWTSPALELAVVCIQAPSLPNLSSAVLALAEPEPLLDVIAVGFPGVADAVRTSISAHPSYTKGNVSRVISGA